MRNLLFLFIIVQSQLISLDIPFYTDIDSIFPGQTRFSSNRVNLLAQRTRKNPKWYDNKRSIFPIHSAFPTVQAPFGYVLVDGHHKVLMSKLLGATTVPIRVIADLKHVSTANFWKKAEKKGWVHPYAIGGVKALPPKSFFELSDDPNRYFATIIRRQQISDKFKESKRSVWIKLKTAPPFIECKIADILRQNKIIYTLNLRGCQ